MQDRSELADYLSAPPPKHGGRSVSAPLSDPLLEVVRRVSTLLGKWKYKPLRF